ncbi:mechanosensitive ion channel family protein [Candidatus Micrarchaeota archaeon]|nr:mechanosensitive ion channel family protein [Candidatus Micrarchaeota archaeon]MBU1165495.1 mechanosensitive ion channel family protein [Candidatus Micrarchaeota archaeon]MBU1886333.1 mechanosensitive ion channel family protein [Candidatus Micrarchaeota archaeon]
MISLGKFFKFLLLFLIAGVFWYATLFYPSEYLIKLFYTFIALASIYVIFNIVIENALIGGIKDNRRKFELRKIISLLNSIIIIAAIITIWIPNPEAILVAYGLIAAAIAIALQDIFKNLGGGVMLLITRIYAVGDRVQINSLYGDVVDIGVFYTTLLETRGWVEGDQVTGRLTTIPNSCVLSGTINNYTKDHGFIWDEIWIPLTYDSNWNKAIELFSSIAKKETHETIKKASQELSQMGEKYFFQQKDADPQIFLKLTDNWMSVNIRYVTEVRSRRLVSNRLSIRLLKEIQKTKDIKLASQTIDIVGFPNSKKV